MSSQYLLASITAIHGKQSTNSQTALPTYSPISLACQAKCNVFLPHKNNSYGLYGESSYETLPPYNHSHIRRKTNPHKPKNEPYERISEQQNKSAQSRKKSHPRTTRSSLFPLIIIHVRRYGESSRGPYHPWGTRMRLPACAYPPVCMRPLAMCTRPSAYARLPGQTGRQEDREDSRRTEQDRQHAGSSSPALPPCSLPQAPAPSACPARLPRLPIPACPLPTLPVCVILSMRAPHAHPAKRPFVKPFYHFPIYQNVMY